MKIPKNSLWVYIGPGSGQGMEHLVIAFDKADQTITTWSRFGDDIPDVNDGYSWKGTITDFYHFFKPIELTAA